MGKPDKQFISTSHVERNNLNIRVGNRRFTKLTNAFSKKWENHCHAIALYFTYYNFCRPHKTLSKPYSRTPAMARRTDPSGSQRGMAIGFGVGEVAPAWASRTIQTPPA